MKNTNQIIAVAPRTGMNAANWKKHGTRSVIQTQALMKFNSGKRVRHICLAHYEDTGESVAKKPRKFLPTQVLRRRARQPKLRQSPAVATVNNSEMIE